MKMISVVNPSAITGPTALQFGWALPAMPIEQLGNIFARNAGDYAVLADVGNTLAQQIPSVTYEGGKGAWDQRQQRRQLYQKSPLSETAFEARTSIPSDNRFRQEKPLFSGNDVFTPSTGASAQESSPDPALSRIVLERGSNFNSPPPEALANDLSLANRYDGAMADYGPKEAPQRSVGGVLDNAFKQIKNVSPPIDPVTSLPSYSA
ncbi:MAG: hypothetical protein VKJ04_01740 [Vampirovibrionales bacterium]|nr:hypothetical protein [Vampirovibrionales bacterium]